MFKIINKIKISITNFITGKKGDKVVSSDTKIESLTAITRDDARKMVLSDSNKKMNKLKMLCSFFNDSVLNEIKDKTELINNIFEKNIDLEYKKLEQFNYYYTDNIIILLSKLKKDKEQNVIILGEKASYLKKKIAEKNINNINIKNIENQRKVFEINVSDLCRNIFMFLSQKQYNDFYFEDKFKNDLDLLKKHPEEKTFYIEEDMHESICDFNVDDCYFAKKYYIGKKLLGKLNKNMFKLSYCGTFVIDKHDTDSKFYMFNINDSNDYFIYYPNKNIFKSIDSTILLKYIRTNNTNWYHLSNEIDKLIDEYNDVDRSINNIKIISDDKDLMNTLNQYLEKISSDDLIKSLNDIDQDRKFLDDVLKLEQIKL